MGSKKTQNGPDRPQRSMMQKSTTRHAMLLGAWARTNKSALRASRKLASVMP